MLRRLAGILGLLTVICSSTGCAAEPADESGDQADAISSEAAAAEWKGAVKVLEEHPAGSSRALAALGVKTWDVYVVRTRSFQGIAYVAVGADRHVKHALLSGSTSSGEGALTLVSYDRAGKTGATDRDAATVRALATDLDAVNDAAEKATLERHAALARQAAAAADEAVVATGKAADAYAAIAASKKRDAEAAGCSADLFTLGGGLVATFAGAAGVAVVGAPVAAVGVALALLAGAVSVAGLGVVGFEVSHMVITMFENTRCFAE
jgi:hypothetical protein